MVMVVARLLFRSSSVCILLCCFNDGYILSCRKCQMEGKRALVGHGIIFGGCMSEITGICLMSERILDPFVL